MADETNTGEGVSWMDRAQKRRRLGLAGLIAAVVAARAAPRLAETAMEAVVERVLFPAIRGVDL